MFGRVRRPTHVIGSYYSLLKGSHQAYFVKWLRGHQKGFWLFSWLSHFFLSKGIGQMNSFPKKAGLNKLRIDLAFSFFLSSVLICHPQTSIATTYAPPQPDPWYSISVEFDASSLPPGVKILEKEFKLSFYQGTSKFRYLHNESSTPLYLVRTLSGPLDWVGHFPPNEVPVKKLLNGKVFELDLRKDVWRVVGPGGVYLMDLLIDSREKVFGVKGPGRPDSVVVPSPKTISFRAIYGRKELILGATVTYEINKEYNPKGDNEYYNSNWFQIRSVHFNQDELPTGLKIGEDRQVRHPLVKLTLVNEGRTALYVTARSEEPVSWVSQFAPGKIPHMKLVDGKVWWFTAPTRSYFGNSDGVGGLVGGSDGEADAQIDEYYIFRESGVVSQQVQADDRPDQVSIPSPQDFAIEAFYGTSPVWLRGKIIYTLNEKYRPDAGKGPPVLVSSTGCMGPGSGKQAVFLVVTIFNSILMNLLFFRILRRRKERSLSIALCIVIGIVESFLIYGGFLVASSWVFYKSLGWMGLQGFNLVALMLTALYLMLSIPLLVRYRFSMRETSVFLVGSFLLIRGLFWISGYN